MSQCPKGELKGRKSTIKSSNVKKLALDCYILTMFTQGDASEIETVFVPSTLKKQPNAVVSEQNIQKSSTFQTEFVVMKSTIHTAMTRITALESKLQNSEKTIENCEKQIQSLTEQNKTLQESIQTLENQKSIIQNKYENLQKDVSENNKLIKQNKERSDSMRNNFEKLSAEQSSKFTTYDAFKKRVNTPLKNLETFDPIMTSNKIKSLEQADQSLSSQVATMKKQLLSLKSYANSVSPQKSTNNTDTTSQTGNKTASEHSTTAKEATTKHTSGATNSESLFESIKRKQQEVTNKTHETSDTNKHDKQEHRTQYIDDMISKNITEIRESSKTINQSSGSAATPSVTTSTAIHNTSRETVDTHIERALPNTCECSSVDKTQTVDLTSPNPSQPQQQKSTFSGSRPTNPNSRDKSTDYQHRKQEAKTFKGVSRKNTTRYYIGHIDSSSTYSGLIEFLEEQELSPTMLHMFKTHNGEYAARVNIPSDQAEIMESRDIP